MKLFKYSCPCCGYITLTEEERGSDEICKRCFWHDDYVQFKDPDYRGGANKMSLREAQQNFMKFGAIEERFVDEVIKSGFAKDKNWKPLDGK